MGRFKTSRQIDQDSRKGWIPGAGSRPPPSTARPQPVISSSTPGSSILPSATAGKSKSALKNEKRAQKKREEKAATERAWDEDSEDDDEGGEGIQAAFAEGDARRAHDDGDDDREEVKGSEIDFPPLGGGGGVPKSIGLDVPVSRPTFYDQAEALEPPPTAPDTTADAPAATAKNDSPTTSTTAPSIISPPANPSSRTNEEDSWRKPKSASTTKPSTGTAPAKSSTPRHPIQGKRDGPIGLANPPPIEESVRGGRGDGRGGAGRGRGRPGGAAGNEVKPAPPEPRVRKEVKVREGGANDISKLADRVRNLVIQNQAPAKEKKTAQ